ILLEIEEWLPALRLCVTSNSRQSSAGSQGVCSLHLPGKCLSSREEIETNLEFCGTQW
ncbi:hypothetical protein STEG23_023542, partial [Scotinomys teguina]